MLALAHDDKDHVQETGALIKLSYPDDPEAKFKANWLLAHTQDPVAGLQVTLESLNQVTGIPRYYLEHPRFLAVYHSGDYEQALDAAINYGMPDFFWGPLLRAAALAQL